jgi:hypothetical protein
MGEGEGREACAVWEAGGIGLFGIERSRGNKERNIPEINLMFTGLDKTVLSSYQRSIAWFPGKETT